MPGDGKGASTKRLWLHRDIAALAMEVETIRDIHDLKAIRDELDGWRVVAVLRQAGQASLAADRAPETFVPFVLHHTGMFPAQTRSNPKWATPKSRGFPNHVHGTVRLKAVRKAIKLGHCQNQLRPLRVKYGQYRMKEAAN